MSVDAERNESVEIGHVLFIDIVVYSKRLVNEQTALVQRLNRIVRSTEYFDGAVFAVALERLAQEHHCHSGYKQRV